MPLSLALIFAAYATTVPSLVLLLPVVPLAVLGWVMTGSRHGISRVTP